MTQPSSQPGLFARLWRARRPQTRFDEPFAFHPETRFVGLGSQPKPEALLRESIGWADIAVRAVANRIASLHFVVKVRDELAPDHPLQLLLDRPSPLFSRSNTLRLLTNYVLNLGDSYLLKVRDGIGTPVELWPMPAHLVQPIPIGGLVPIYRVTVGRGRQIEIPANEIIRAWLPDPETLYTGEGYLGPQALTVDADKFSEETLRAHFEHDATPRTVISGDKDAVSPTIPEIDAYSESWVQRYSRRLGRNRGAPAWLPAGFTLQELSALGGITELNALRAQNRDKLLMTFGVPRSIVGDVVDANRAAAETNQFVFDVHTVSPLTDLISEALTFQLARTEFGPDVTVEFAQFVARDKDFELRARESRLSTKFASVNMEREEMGEDPVEWGALPVGTLADVPYTGETFDFEPIDGDDRARVDLDARPARPDPALYNTESSFMAACVPQVISEGKSQEQAVAQCSSIWKNRSLEAKAATLARMEWLRVVNRERRFIPRFARLMASVFVAQERETIAALRDAGLGKRGVRHDKDALTWANGERDLSDEQILGIIDSLFGRDDAFEDLFDKRVEPLRKRAFMEAAEDAVATAATLTGLTFEPFVLAEASARILAGQAASLRTLVNEFTLKRLASEITSELAEGAVLGESAAKRARRIEAVVGQTMRIQRKRSLRIARTEMLKATQSAQIEGFQSTGVIAGKRWNTSQDVAVRDQHRIDGTQVPLTGNFALPGSDDGKVPAELASAPGVGVDGGRLSAANAVNCRCFLTPVVDVEG